MKKKTVEAKFMAYLQPKWEKEEDVKEMINNYHRKQNKKSLYSVIPEDMEIEQQKEKIKKERERIVNIIEKEEKKMTEEQFRQYRKKAEDEIITLTR